MKTIFLTQPYLLTLQPSTEMNIVWIQREPIEGLVEYGKTEKLEQSIPATCFKITGLRQPSSESGYAKNPEDNPMMPVWQCIAKIEGLEPGERIFYRCAVNDQYTQVYHFHTAPTAGDSFRFAQVSDLQGILPCDESVYRIGCKKPDFILYSGDVASISWRADQWFDLQESWQDLNQVKKAFFPCMQQNGAQLMQYAPTFICPGNHEMDDYRCCKDKTFSLDDRNWNWSIFMQIFRPLYQDTDTTLSGKRWYSVDYGDMHIVSLSVNRCSEWGAYEYPGWRMYDSIAPESPQIKWLKQDLSNSKTKFKWVIQHWHLLNKGEDVQPNLCDPMVEDGRVSYPKDYGKILMDIYEAGGVNAVSYGHSHVYERYYAQEVHYIEAAYLSICYREKNAKVHPSGLLPVVEDNSRRSFLIVERREGGLFASGYYVGDVPELFDYYQIADEVGCSVAPIITSQL